MYSVMGYTEGFSAPELVHGDMEKISAATDVYSVGAVIFFKLFGKKPGVWERAWNAEYPFSEMRFLDERYQPKLFSRLTTFFHKTLHSEASMRYQKMEDVYAALEELERLSDVEGMTLLHNFSYKFSQFVGKGEELAQIQNAFTEADVIFLAGMGGIGKTELARRFAHEFRNEFNRIVFLRFTNGIMETVCSDELVITGCDKEEQESPAEFYARKLSNLKRVVDRDDLLILDNFDKSGKDHAIEADAHLNDLLNCGCKILVTTRETFWREYNYVQIDVGVLKSDAQRRELFRINNGKNYSRDEWESINELFCLFENHTMTIALFAKYLFYIEETPSKLLERMKEKEGFNSGETSYQEAAEQARRERRYEEAIFLYKKAIEKGEWDASLLQCGIGRSYLELEEFEKAEKTLLAVLKAEEENKADVSAILAILVQLYERRGDAGNVVFYCNQIVQEQLPFSKEGDLRAVTNVLAFGIKKAKWEGGGKIASKREEYLAWNACFHILDGCEILDDVLVEAYLEYAKYCWEINCAEEALELLFSAAEKYRKGWWRYDSA